MNRIFQRFSNKAQSDSLDLSSSNNLESIPLWNVVESNDHESYDNGQGSLRLNNKFSTNLFLPYKSKPESVTNTSSSSDADSDRIESGQTTNQSNQDTESNHSESGTESNDTSESQSESDPESDSTNDQSEAISDSDETESNSDSETAESSEPASDFQKHSNRNAKSRKIFKKVNNFKDQQYTVTDKLHRRKYERDSQQVSLIGSEKLKEWRRRQKLNRVNSPRYQQDGQIKAQTEDSDQIITSQIMQRMENKNLPQIKNPHNYDISVNDKKRNRNTQIEPRNQNDTQTHAESQSESDSELESGILDPDMIDPDFTDLNDLHKANKPQRRRKKNKYSAQSPANIQIVANGGQLQQQNGNNSMSSDSSVAMMFGFFVMMCCMSLVVCGVGVFFATRPSNTGPGANNVVKNSKQSRKSSGARLSRARQWAQAKVAKGRNNQENHNGSDYDSQMGMSMTMQENISGSYAGSSRAQYRSEMVSEMGNADSCCPIFVVLYFLCGGGIFLCCCDSFWSTDVGRNTEKYLQTNCSCHRTTFIGCATKTSCLVCIIFFIALLFNCEGLDKLHLFHPTLDDDGHEKHKSLFDHFILGIKDDSGGHGSDAGNGNDDSDGGNTNDEDGGNGNGADGGNGNTNDEDGGNGNTNDEDGGNGNTNDDDSDDSSHPKFDSDVSSMSTKAAKKALAEKVGNGLKASDLSMINLNDANKNAAFYDSSSHTLYVTKPGLTIWEVNGQQDKIEIGGKMYDINGDVKHIQQVDPSEGSSESSSASHSGGSGDAPPVAGGGAQDGGNNSAFSTILRHAVKYKEGKTGGAWYLGMRQHSKFTINHSLNNDQVTLLGGKQKYDMAATNWSNDKFGAKHKIIHGITLGVGNQFTSQADILKKNAAAGGGNEDMFIDKKSADSDLDVK